MAKVLRVLLVCFCLCMFTLLPLPANAQTEQRSYLTLEILQDRIDHLVKQEGRDTIDLSNYIIDLANPDSDFGLQFYQKINNIISRAGNPLSLNFSNSIIQGNFQLNQLGINSYIGSALSSIFSTLEQAKINQYYPAKNNINQQVPRINIFRGSLKFNDTIFTGEVDASDSLFLQQIIATGTKFQNIVKYNHSFFGKEVDFSQAVFSQNINFSLCHFFATTKFRQVEFQGIADFSNSQFEELIEFNDSMFNQLADFTRSVFIKTANFSNNIYCDRLVFAKSKFLDSLLFINTTFEKNITFRDSYANFLINLQDAHLLNRLDFSNAFFSVLFWFIDRFRPRISQPIIPNRYEIIVMATSYLSLTSLSIINIFITTEQPWLTLLCIGIIFLPVPALITGLIYKQGRYHNLLNTTYFVEDGSFREFRLLLGRLPIMPRFPFYRDRYQPILWHRRWSWLNYYNFSLNNIFKLGFNDIRLRDQHLPGLISTLVWYQWCLGVLYIILLLWTLSRTIPGLNLLIYF